MILPAYKGRWNVGWTKTGAVVPEKIDGKYWMYFLGTAADKTDQMGLQSIAMASAKAPPTLFAIAVSGAIAGGIGYALRADVERIGAEVGSWLGFEFWSKGIATAALKAVTRHAFTAHAQLRRLYAAPSSSNRASARVLTKAGYRCEGTLRQSAIKDGQVLDQRMYSILRNEVESA